MLRFSGQQTSSPQSRGRQIDEGIKTTPKYFEMQTEQSISCARVKPAKNLVESSVQLVPIKNETLFSCGAGIPDPSEVRTQRGFPYPGTYCSHKVKQTPRKHLKKTLVPGVRHRKQLAAEQPLCNAQPQPNHIGGKPDRSPLCSAVAVFKTMTPEGVKKILPLPTHNRLKLNSQQFKFNLPDFPCGA